MSERKFRSFLKSAEVPLEDFLRAQKFFKDRKISMGYNDKRDTITFMGFFVDAPIPCIHHCGPGAFREYMDAPSELISAMREESVAALVFYSMSKS